MVRWWVDGSIFVAGINWVAFVCDARTISSVTVSISATEISAVPFFRTFDLLRNLNS